VTLRIYDDWEQARRTVLRRRRMVATEGVPEPVRAGIRRIFGEELTPEQAVARILADVRQRGDDAIRDWTARIDGLALDDLEVQAEALEAAYRALPADLAATLALSAARIRDFHARQPIPSWTTTEMGGTLGQRVIPVQQVGVYAPGGTAPLPSSLLMAVIPARVAGVDEVVVCTPPGREGGRVPGVILAAAHVAGVDRLFRLGGAQAIGALAYGTATVPKVDKIVGAGGLFTTLAKRQVYGQVGLDGLYGPTETVVVADDSANPAWVAADLLAQAEHDVLATAILLTPYRPLAEAVQAEVARRMEDLSRADVIATSLAGQGGIVLTPDLETAVRLADEFAPEHLCLSVREPERWASSIRNTGGLFLGEHSFEVLGDYVAGPSHIMPTGGTAKWASPVNVLGFCKIINVIGLDAETAAQIGPAAARIADAESLTAHAAAASARSGADDAPGPEGRNHLRRREWDVRNEEIPMDATTLICPNVATMAPYTPIFPLEVLANRLGRDPGDIVKLDANENPYGSAPGVRAALANLRYAHIYPDPRSHALRAALADFTGIPADLLLAGAGADELIDLTVRLFLQPGDAIINCPPTFGMYAFDAAISGANVISVPRRADFSLDLDAVEAAVLQQGPKLVFVTSPNNPDGSWLPDADLEQLLALPLVVVLDEAYVEFAGMERSRIQEVPKRDNLIVLRTLSKVAGLAGLRIGYGAFPGTLTPHLWKIKQPYNVSVAASAAAVAALQDRAWLEQKIALIVQERERLKNLLSDIPYLHPYPSESNFVLCQVVGRDARELKLALEEQGILIRYFDKPGLRDHVRISVGRPEQTDTLLAALRRI
jgi:histidinol dehydrogenase